MHLLSAQTAPAHLEDEAVDLGQTPGEILLLSAADTELACLAAARARLGADFPRLRLANLLKLQHPFSVDLYVERMVPQAKLVLVRLLGGKGYWTYGVEQLVAACATAGTHLALLPGDDRPDPELARLSTLPAPALERLHAYLRHGGIENALQALRFAGSLIGGTFDHRPPAPMPPAGLYRHGTTVTPADLPAGDRPLALLLFYRALLQAGDLAPVDAVLAALERQGLDAAGLYVTSLKEPAAAELMAEIQARRGIAVLLNATGFTVGGAGGREDPLALPDRPVLQIVFASEDEAGWRQGSRGLLPRDLAMNVALTEIDGRVLARAVSFKAPAAFDPSSEIAVARHAPVADRVEWSAALAAAWARLAETPAALRRVAIILANYPNRDGRLANGVGLDTPESAALLLRELAAAGYAVEHPPADGAELIAALQAGVTNARRQGSERLVRARLDFATYRRHFAALPADLQEVVRERWGEPESDPLADRRGFPLAVLPLGRVVVGLQPPRGFGLDLERTYHDPELVPPHGYLAFYIWLRAVFGAQAVVHLGKHGNLEWLPGKALALSERCWPEAAMAPLPHLYPFIVNDPGEGTQAKRRSAAVIIDHLTPPLARAGAHGGAMELERLLDEYALAQSLDPRRQRELAGAIADTAQALGLSRDLGLDDLDEPERLTVLDRHLCELKELQIRDGLHVLGRPPTGHQRHELLLALARLPRGRGEGADASLTATLAKDLRLGGFDPLAADPATPWDGARPTLLTGSVDGAWRTVGDTIERLEALALELVAGTREAAPGWRATRPVLDHVRMALAVALDQSAHAEISNLLAGLDGRRVPPGPAGAPTRGRLDVLPTGRNFFSVDTRAVPTPAAWAIGWRSAQAVVEHYLQRHGDWPRRVALSAWGTANMRTGGDDIAQALALLGCRPTWDAESGRVTGVEVLPLAVLDRPRVDVTMRLSGFFRDAFPAQIEFLDDAIRAVAALDEPEEQNPLAAAVAGEESRLLAAGLSAGEARRLACARLYSSRPGTYGTGLQGLVDDGAWTQSDELARAFTAWGGHAYGRSMDGVSAQAGFERRLEAVELVLHNQDNREHDILDSDDYWQFQGGLAAAARHLAGRSPEIFHNDHSNPARLRVRAFEEELSLIVRGRATNPKWLEGVMRHGYKGTSEIAATVDYLFAYAATTGRVAAHHFEALYEAYLADESVRAFMAEHNPAALREIASRFTEAVERGLWQPRSNSASVLLGALAAEPQIQ